MDAGDVLRSVIVLCAKMATQVADGAKAVADGAKAVADGAKAVADGAKAVADGGKAATSPNKVLLEGYYESDTADGFVMVNEVEPSDDKVVLFVNSCQRAADIHEQRLNEVGLRGAASVWYSRRVFETTLTHEEKVIADEFKSILLATFWYIEHDANLTSEKTEIADEFKRILRETPDVTIMSRHRKLEQVANAYARRIPK